jgi:AcrR family transcriptional regulator
MRNALKLSTNAKVIAAAATLFHERGFESTTVRDIALAAQVSVGTVMSFGDKSALLVRIFDEGIERLHSERVLPPGAESPNAVVRSLQSACADRVFELLHPFVVLFAEQAGLARSYASILVGGKHASRVFTELAQMLKREIREVISDQNGGCAADPEPRTEALYLAYIGMLFTWSADGSLMQHASGANSALSPVEGAALGQRLHETLAVFCFCGKQSS